MREILFRGKRIDNGKWVTSGNIIKFNPECGEELVFIPAMNEKCTCTHDKFDNIISFEKTTIYKVNPKTVGQFTGLTDKNGKKVFEGDIVRCVRTMCDEKEMVGHILFDDCCFSVKDIKSINQPAMDLCDSFEVIGNIHDNPELLEVE